MECPDRDDRLGSVIESHLPLKPTWLHVLLAVSAGCRHGYAIRQEVEERTGGQVRLWPTTLYGSLAEMVDMGLLEQAEPDEKGEDPRRRHYRLTELGRLVLGAEAERLAELAALAQTRLAVRRH